MHARMKADLYGAGVTSPELLRRLASQEGIDYCDALKRVQEYDPNPPTPAEVAEAFRFKYF